MKTTEEILEENGLNWRVTKEKLMYAGECTPSANNGLHHTDFYGVVREDTGEVFTTVKEGYTPTQNHVIIDTMRKIAGDNDLEIVKEPFYCEPCVPNPYASLPDWKQLDIDSPFFKSFQFIFLYKFIN